MITLFRWLLTIVFGLFLTRAADLMIIKGSYFRRLADNNRIKRIRLSPARGRITDRHGRDLARNTIRYFNEKEEEISREEALVYQAEGKTLAKIWVREYPLGEATAHLTGYLGEASQGELGERDGHWIDLGDLVGRGGVEEYYDSHLRGEPGERMVEVGAKGEFIRELGRRDPRPGEDLELTIDLQWQEAAWQAIKGRKGAVVVLDPWNGAVLALVSYPSFDPNLFTKNRDDQKIEQLLNDPNLPFLDRAISGAYHPGSVFKMVTAIAGLEEGRIDKDKLIEDVGEIKIGDWRFGNWYWLQYGRKEGMVDLVKAIKRSNDIYFYKVGEWLGAESLLSWAKRFGLGSKRGIDLPNEVSGFLPSPEWKEKLRGEQWFLGNTYHLAIGQGDITATPLQIALETAVIANQGRLCRPHLAGEKECQTLGIKEENLSLVKQGMIEACSSGGTGFPFFDFYSQVACKTGTAEIGNIDQEAHAWFTLFYPAEEPKAVITVLIERGGSGAYVAAPVAKETIERYEGRFKEEVGN